VQTSGSTISCFFVLVVMLMMFVELLVEQYCEPTQSLCPCDHAFIYASSYFSKTIILATSLFFQAILFVQNKSQDLSLRQSFYQN
jgi:hypothetical protein